jgi:hypothetical protein
MTRGGPGRAPKSSPGYLPVELPWNAFVFEGGAQGLCDGTGYWPPGSPHGVNGETGFALCSAASCALVGVVDQGALSVKWIRAIRMADDLAPFVLPHRVDGRSCVPRCLHTQ